MKIILLRFQKENIHFLECNIKSGNLILGNKEKITLKSAKRKGERFKKILDELSRIQTKYSPDIFTYESPQKYRGSIKDTEGFANSTMLNLFCCQNNFKLFELTPTTVRKKLNIPNKDFKNQLEETKDTLIQEYPIKKSDQLLKGLIFLYMLRETL